MTQYPAGELPPLPRNSQLQLTPKISAGAGSSSLLTTQLTHSLDAEDSFETRCNSVLDSPGISLAGFVGGRAGERTRCAGGLRYPAFWFLAPQRQAKWSMWNNWSNAIQPSRRVICRDSHPPRIRPTRQTKNKPPTDPPTTRAHAHQSPLQDELYYTAHTFPPPFPLPPSGTLTLTQPPTAFSLSANELWGLHVRCGQTGPAGRRAGFACAGRPE